jgi:N6-adenosine-specific RNA methylase IME4
MTQASLFSTRAIALGGIPLPPKAGAYRVLYIDDPWPEKGGGQIKRGADGHYDVMSVKDIAALPFGAWAAPDAHCYMWATNNYLPEAFEIMRIRGFRYVTTVTWVKTGRIGLGQYFRGKTEHCLFGVRGRLPYRLLDSGKRAQGETVIYAPEEFDATLAAELPEPDLPSAFEAARPTESGKIKHSRKPEIMRQIIERVSAGPYLEIFARRLVPGWDVWGNQSGDPRVVVS